MKRAYFFLIFLLFIMPTNAETGIVLNETNYVQYKYDTDTRPTLEPGEYIILYDEVDSVHRWAKWNGTVFINPLPPLEPKQRQAIIDSYQQAMSDIADAKANLAIIRNQTDMTEIQQTNNIRKLADYQYKIFDILYNILRFLKFAFFTG